MSESEYMEMARETHEDLRESGAPCALDQTVSADYNTTSGEVEAGKRKFNGYAVRHDHVLREIAGEIVEGDIGLLMSVFTENGDPMPEPKVGNIVLFDGSRWRVQVCSPLKPATVAVLYQVQARK